MRAWRREGGGGVITAEAGQFVGFDATSGGFVGNLRKFTVLNSRFFRNYVALPPSD